MTLRNYEKWLFDTEKWLRTGPVTETYVRRNLIICSLPCSTDTQTHTQTQTQTHTPTHTHTHTHTHISTHWDTLTHLTQRKHYYLDNLTNISLNVRNSNKEENEEVLLPLQTKTHAPGFAIEDEVDKLLSTYFPHVLSAKRQTHWRTSTLFYKSYKNNTEDSK